MNLSLNQAVQILTQPHPLHLIWQIYLTQIQAQALDFSIEKKLFASLFQFEDASVLAEKHDLHPQNSDYLLQLLASLQLLDTQFDPARQAMLYRIKPALKDYLNPVSDQYCGDALLYRQQVIQSVAGQLSASFSHDFQAQYRTAETIGSAWAQAAQIQIAQEQNAVTVHIADVLSDLICEFKTATHFLDVGAGAGRVAIHLAEKFAQLECTLLELPHVIDAIRPTLQNHPAHQRLHCLAADLQSLDFQTLDFQTLKSQPQYDIIWCSSVLHFVDDYALILEKLLAALSPNGVLICCHSEIDPSQYDTRIQSYYLNMRMQGNFVPQKDDIYRSLKQLGCQHIETIENVQFPVAPVDVLIARK